MTLPTGTITLDQVAAELGIGLPLSLGDARVLALAGKGGLPISLGDLYGRSAYTPMSPVGYDYQYDTAGGTGVQYTLATHPTVSVTGGTGGYSYNWVFVSGTAGTVVNNNSSDPGIRYTIGKYGATINATYRCDITDNTAHTVSATVNIRIV